jgi:hypothetical protein
MNKENILKLANHIESLRHIGDDEALGQGVEGFNLNREVFTCGTPACIAGWAVSFQRHTNQIADDEEFTNDAMKYLGVNEYEYDDLCYPFYAKAISSFDDVTPAQAAKVLRNLAETGVVDWDVITETAKPEEE